MSALSQFIGSDTPYWVSGATYQVGKVVRSPSTHQLFVRAVAGAGTTDPDSDTTNWRPNGGRAIKSIQRGVTTPTNPTELVVTVASINPAKAILNLLSSSSSHLAGKDSNVRVSLRVISATTIGVQSGFQNESWNQGGMSVSWELIEYY